MKTFFNIVLKLIVYLSFSLILKANDYVNFNIEFEKFNEHNISKLYFIRNYDAYKRLQNSEIIDSLSDILPNSLQNINLFNPKFDVIYLRISPSENLFSIICEPGDSIKINIYDSEYGFKFKAKIKKSGIDYNEVFNNIKNKNELNKFNCSNLIETSQCQDSLLNVFNKLKRNLENSSLTFNQKYNDDFVKLSINYLTNKYIEKMSGIYLNTIKSTNTIKSIDSTVLNRAISYFNNYNWNHYFIEEGYFTNFLELNFKIGKLQNENAIDKSAFPFYYFQRIFQSKALSFAYTDYFFEKISFMDDYSKESKFLDSLLSVFKEKIGVQRLDYLENLLRLKSNLNINKTFPNVDIYDTSHKKTTYDLLKNYYTYIYIYATWCSPCLEHLEHARDFEDILKKYNVRLFLVSIDASFNQWRLFVEKKYKDFYNYISLGNSINSISSELGINSVPHGILLNPEGKIIDIDSFLPGNNETEQWLKKLIK